MWDFKINITILVVLILNFCHFTVIAKESSGMINYNHSIKKIALEIPDLTSTFDLLLSQEFVDLYKNPKQHIQSVIHLYQSEDFNDHEKEVAIYTMHGLELDQFIAYANRLLTLYQEKKISSQLFKMAIFPLLDWNSILVINYKDKRVKEFLMRLQDCDLMADKNFNKLISDISSGEQLKFYNEYKKYSMVNIEKHIDKTKELRLKFSSGK